MVSEEESHFGRLRIMMKILNQLRRSEWWIPTALTIAIGAFSIYLHFQDNTMPAHSDKLWDQRITMHRLYFLLR